MIKILFCDDKIKIDATEYGVLCPVSVDVLGNRIKLLQTLAGGFVGLEYTALPIKYEQLWKILNKFNFYSTVEAAVVVKKLREMKLIK